MRGVPHTFTMHFVLFWVSCFKRFPMPAALCSYCLGETRIGKQYQLGNVRKIKWEEEQP